MASYAQEIGAPKFINCYQSQPFSYTRIVSSVLQDAEVANNLQNNLKRIL